MMQDCYDCLLPDDLQLPEPPEPQICRSEPFVAVIEPEHKKRRQSRKDKKVSVGQIETESSKAKKHKKKRERPVEFDPDSGEWTDVRRFDRMPITVEQAEICEQENKVPHGSYFVSLARKRIAGIVELHQRWMSKMKNECSEYAGVQRGLLEFFQFVQVEFDQRYFIYTAHPMFESIGKARKRLPKSSN